MIFNYFAYLTKKKLCYINEVRQTFAYMKPNFRRMKMKRKLVCCLLCAAMLLGLLTGCGSKTEPPRTDRRSHR